MASKQLARIFRVSGSLYRIRYLHKCAEQNSVQYCLYSRCSPSLLKTQCRGFHSSYIGYNKSSIINIQDEDDFKERVLNNQTPVIVDFHANWCGPCKLLGPRLETLVGIKNNEEQKVIMAKVDIDEMPDIAMEYGVEAVPTVISVKGGKVTNKFIGLKEDDEIETFIRKLIE